MQQDLFNIRLSGGRLSWTPLYRAMILYCILWHGYTIYISCPSNVALGLQQRSLYSRIFTVS